MGIRIAMPIYLGVLSAGQKIKVVDEETRKEYFYGSAGICPKYGHLMVAHMYIDGDTVIIETEDLNQ